ncbi:MAG: DKNYY domain-containing protein [Nitrospirota bacterium]
MKKIIKISLFVLILGVLAFLYNWNTIFDCDKDFETNLPNGYHKGIFGVYMYRSYDSEGCKITKLKVEGADKSSFEVLSNFYSRDENHVYYEYTFPDPSVNRIEEADPVTFEVLVEDSSSMYQYAIDKNHLYLRDRIIENANANTFAVLENGYSRDHKSVFWEEIQIVGADPESFKIIDFPFSKDENHVFNGAEIDKSFDAQSFSSTGENNFFQDKSGLYYCAFNSDLFDYVCKKTE